MTTSKQWYDYFKQNVEVKRVNWNQSASLTDEELSNVLRSLQAWQLGETSEGKDLIAASKRYANKVNDPFYVQAIELFIKEEQKHGNNLGRFLDMLGKPRIEKDLGDSLFRKIRHLNTSMEWWTLAVITVESAAQIFYQCLKDATKNQLLKEICTDILIDEAPHIQFQMQRFRVIFQSKSVINKKLSFAFYKLFYFSTTLVVWMAHKKLFKAGGNGFKQYWKKMTLKFTKTIGRLANEIHEPRLAIKELAIKI
jgi:hypothetical protein